MCKRIIMVLNNIATHFECKTNGKTYLSLLHLRNQKVNPLYFTGCGNVGVNVRPCIAKNSIPENSVLFIDNNKVSNAVNKKSQPYVEETYATEWILDIHKIKTHRAALKSHQVSLNKEAIQQQRTERNAIESETKLEQLPDIIDADEFTPTTQGFVDEDGIVLPIEMRGEPTVKGLMFKALDLQKAFGTERIYNIVTNPHRMGFEYGKHYKIYCGYINDVTTSKNKHPIKNKNTVSDKHLYLTYFGVVRYLINCRSPKVEPFQMWAINILFTHQFGCQDSKDSLAANLLDVSPKTICNVFRRCTDAIPCIYLMKIGCVADIRAYFETRPNDTAPNFEGLSDNDIMYKYGETNDLHRRTKEHLRSYGKWSKDFTCEKFTYIDPAFVCKAEKYIKGIFKISNMHVNDSCYVELVVIPPDKMKYVEQSLIDAKTLFSGNSKDLLKKLETLENKFNHDTEILKNKHENELLKCHHENELLKLRLEYASNTL